MLPRGNPFTGGMGDLIPVLTSAVPPCAEASWRMHAARPGSPGGQPPECCSPVPAARRRLRLRWNRGPDLDAGSPANRLWSPSTPAKTVVIRLDVQSVADNATPDRSHAHARDGDRESRPGLFGELERLTARQVERTRDGTDGPRRGGRRTRRRPDRRRQVQLGPLEATTLTGVISVACGSGSIRTAIRCARK